ncbi:MAG: universal stress protein [Bryobacteraceae bacterium]|nr:universal stress protein [Bryobacteraceae bacterium]
MLATDFSKPAQRAYEYAIALARPLHATLNLLHVVKAAWDGSESEPGSRPLRSLKTAALLNLGQLARLASELGVQAEPHLAVGNPAACILDASRKTRTNLLVTGTSGRTGWDRLQLGSTAEALVRVSPSAVLTVREMVPGDPGHSLRRLEVRRLLVATDFSSGAEAALSVAYNLARAIGAELTIVHVVADSGREGSRGSVRRSKDGLSPTALSAGHAVDRLARDLAAEGVMVHTSCVQGDPVEMLLREAARCGTDILVAGTQGRSGLPRLLLGSVAEALIRRAACPVMTVKRSLDVRGKGRGALCNR